MKELSDVQVLNKMVGVLLRQQGLMQWVDCWAAGQNEGGMYVSLFNSRANFRICNVYSEKFPQLPDFIRNSIPASGIEIGTEKERVAKKGLLKECPAFCITRYQLDAGDEKAKWHFGDVLYIKQSNNPQQPPSQEPSRPVAPAIKKVEIDPVTALQIECESLGNAAYGATEWGSKRAKFSLRASKDRPEPVDKLANLTASELTVMKDGLQKVVNASLAVTAN